MGSCLAAWLGRITSMPWTLPSRPLQNAVNRYVYLCLTTTVILTFPFFFRHEALLPVRHLETFFLDRSSFLIYADLLYNPPVSSFVPRHMQHMARVCLLEVYLPIDHIYPFFLVLKGRSACFFSGHNGLDRKPWHLLRCRSRCHQRRRILSVHWVSLRPSNF